MGFFGWWDGHTRQVGYIDKMAIKTGAIKTRAGEMLWEMMTKERVCENEMETKCLRELHHGNYGTAQEL